jgi:hypothetical protein
VPNKSLGLVLPEGDADGAFTLAHGETNMRLRGERRPAFEEIVAQSEALPEGKTPGRRRRIHVRGHFVYRKKTGQFASRKKWARSHGPKGKYVRAWQAGYYYDRGVAGIVGSPLILPALPGRSGPYDTLEEAWQAFTRVKHGEPLAGPKLDRRLKALGLAPLRLTIQGAFSKVPGGPLFLWEADGAAVAGLSLATYPGLLDQITRDWRDANDSPPVILVSRLGVEPLAPT